MGYFVVLGVKRERCLSEDYFLILLRVRLPLTVVPTPVRSMSDL